MAKLKTARVKTVPSPRQRSRRQRRRRGPGSSRTPITPGNTATRRSRPSRPRNDRVGLAVHLPHARDGGAETARASTDSGGAKTSPCGRSTKPFRRSRLPRPASSGSRRTAINLFGGAVAMGHPIGASGGASSVPSINQLRKRGGGLGIASICSGAAGRATPSSCASRPTPYEVLVVGAGQMGPASLKLPSQSGLDVLLADRHGRVRRRGLD